MSALSGMSANPALRRLGLAAAGSITGDWAYGVAISVYAFTQGGAAAVGLVNVVQLLPAALAAPFVAVLGDRHSRRGVMLASDLVSGVVIAIAAAVIAVGGPAGLVYTLASVAFVAGRAVRPARAALLPSLARSPEELTAANVATSSIDGAATFLGPALAGVLLSLTGPTTVLVIDALTFAWSFALVVRIPLPAAPTASAEQPRAEPGEPAGWAGSEVFSGFRTILGDHRLRVLVGLYSAQTLVAGTLVVVIVVMAFDVFHTGAGGVGALNAAVGVGGLVGTLAWLGLVGGQRLAGAFAVGMILWGAPMIALGIWPLAAAALVLLGVVGVGNTLVDVSIQTLLQRAVPDQVLARVFGVLESLLIGTIALGASVAPALIHLLGARGALIATGSLLPILALVFWRRLAALDTASPAPAHVGLLRGVPFLAPLPEPVMEHLAAKLVPVTATAGETIFRQGAPGDRFYVIEHGEIVIKQDGQPIATVPAGGYFGEIALLRAIPRTASASATMQTMLLTLERDEFIAAVTGHAPSARTADAVIAARLGGLRAEVATI